MLRWLHIWNGVLFLPTIAYGFMVGLSGGGLSPYPQIGNSIFLVAVGIPLAIVAGLVFSRIGWRWAAWGVGVLPTVALVVLSVVLQMRTGWFG